MGSHNHTSKFTNLFFCFCLCALFLALPAVGQANPNAVIQHIIILIRESRSFDHYFGSYPTGGPFKGNCKPPAAGGLSSCPSSGVVTLAPGNPNAGDCGGQDCPHSALSLIDAMDVTNGSAAMDGFGGYCSGGTQTLCWLGQPCSAGYTCNLAAYTYYDRTTIPFYWQMADLYGLGKNFFSYPNGPSYPNHLAMIAARTNEALDEPYTHASTNQWTCDEVSVGGSQPVCSGTCRVGAAPCTSNDACGSNNGCINVTCSGGFTYESQTLSQAVGDESVLGTPVQAGDYYYGGMCQDNVTPCICDTGQTLPGAMSNPGTCTSGGTESTSVHGGDSCGSGGVCNTASSLGSTRGSICPEVTTITDRLDAAGISWGYYAPLTNNVNGYFWTAPAYVRHIRYGPDWTTNVYGVPAPFDQAVTSCTSVSSCTLPSVVWVSSGFPNSEHPSITTYPNATVAAGQAWTMARLQNIFNQPGQYVYNSSIIFVVWDDPGGFYDHVPPPTPGLGMRVPILCIGPYCTHGIINTQLEFGSILKCIENPPYVPGVNPQPWKLDNLGGRDLAAANDACAAMVNLTQTPIPAPTQLARSLTTPAKQPSAESDRDLITLAKQVYGWFRPANKSRRDEDESALPTLATKRPCLDGTKLHRAYYVTKAGKFPVEVCGSDDGKLILWPGESHQDDDENDRPKTQSWSQRNELPGTATDSNNSVR